MQVGIIGAGHIGGNIARRLALAGHEVTVSFARDRAALTALATDIGARAAQPKESARNEVVVMSVPWAAIDQALAAAGSLAGRIVIDTANQFGPAGVLDLGGKTGARINADRMPGARYTKSFNTLTAAFQAAAAMRTGPERVVQWIAGDDSEARSLVGSLIADAGYVPHDLAGIDDCAALEAPRRPGSVYGEEYREADVQAVIAAVRAGRPVPAPPVY